MSLSLNQKMSRVIEFLMATKRYPLIFNTLRTRGFKEVVFEEGWRLFELAAGRRLNYGSNGKAGEPTPPSNVTAQLLADLDNWENTWFPVVDATLKRHYPESHGKIFYNLSQTSGYEVVVSVKILLDRLDDYAKTTEGAAANVLLAERGLTDSERGRARELLDQLRRIDSSSLPQPDPVTLEEQQQAAVDVWAWYREWSQIARSVITRGDLLVKLGLRKIKRGSKGELEEEVDLLDAEENPAMVVVPPSPAGTGQPGAEA